MMLNARRLIVMTGFLLSVGAILTTSEVQAQAETHPYVNEEFGFSVEIPKDGPTCGAEPETHDHGIAIFLDRGPSACRDIKNRPYVSLYGDYNATDEQSPFEIVARHCKTQKAEETTSEEFGDLKNQWPAMCRTQSKDGFVDIELAGQTPRVRADIAPIVNYSAFIHARPEELSAALEAATAILRSVRFFHPTGYGVYSDKPK